MLQTDYRISFTLRNDSEHSLIKERVIEEGIKDINELTRKISFATVLRDSASQQKKK